MKNNSKYHTELTVVKETFFSDQCNAFLNFPQVCAFDRNLVDKTMPIYGKIYGQGSLLDGLLAFSKVGD